MVETELTGVEGNRAEAFVLELLTERLGSAVLRVAEDGMSA